MSRRSILLAAALAAVALGAAWWLLDDGLTAEQRRLVGTWHCRVKQSGFSMTHVMTLAPDRRARICLCSSSWPPTMPPYWWHARAGTFVLEPEPSAFRRAVRPIAALLGLQVHSTGRATLEWETDDEVVMVGPGGDRARWARVAED